MIDSNLLLASTQQTSLPSCAIDTSDNLKSIALTPENILKGARWANYESTPWDLACRKILKKGVREAGGIALGGLAGAFTHLTGLDTALHEYVGHVLLGLRLTHDYARGDGPSVQLDSLDQIHKIQHAHSFGDKFKHVFRLMTGYDNNHDGASGITYHGNGTPNALGRAMGDAGLQAWISIAGSIPGLVLNSLAVAGGMQLRRVSPVAGSMCVGFGITSHVISSSYAWSAAVMSPHQLARHAAEGHDFANFAVQIGHITGIAPQVVAIGTAGAWTAFVPAIALLMYAYQKCHETDIVPDQVALQEWIQKAVKDKAGCKELQKYIEKYPRKERLAKLWQAWLEDSKPSLDLRLEMRRFTEYLLDKLPKKTLHAAKKDVLHKWQKLQKSDRIQNVLTVLSIIGTASTLAVKVLTVLGQTIAPYLATAASALTYLSPVFIAVSVISAGYETYQDLKMPDLHCPKAAKMISVAKLVVAIVTAAGICVGMFVPGLNGVLIASIVGGLVIGITLAVARYILIKRRFALLQALEPGTWESMRDLLVVYRQDHNGDVDVKKDDKEYRGLYHWIEKVKKAKSKGLLSKEQVSELKNLGLVSC